MIYFGSQFERWSAHGSFYTARPNAHYPEAEVIVCTSAIALLYYKLIAQKCACNRIPVACTYTCILHDCRGIYIYVYLGMYIHFLVIRTGSLVSIETTR